VWKIADFGLTCEGTSRKAHTTVQSRGTCSFRPPELLPWHGDKSTFTTKVDIWAIGCIFYEIVCRERRFVDDLAVQNYVILSMSQGMFIPTLPDLAPREREFVAGILQDTLAIFPANRPKASELYERFTKITNEKVICSPMNDRQTIDLGIAFPRWLSVRELYQNYSTGELACRAVTGCSAVLCYILVYLSRNERPGKMVAVWYQVSMLGSIGWNGILAYGKMVS